MTCCVCSMLDWGGPIRQREVHQKTASFTLTDRHRFHHRSPLTHHIKRAPWFSRALVAVVPDDGRGVDVLLPFSKRPQTTPNSLFLVVVTRRDLEPHSSILLIHGATKKWKRQKKNGKQKLFPRFGISISTLEMKACNCQRMLGFHERPLTCYFLIRCPSLIPTGNYSILVIQIVFNPQNSLRCLH